ncbi:thioredoxin family protein [Reichenbachiella agarivorans]|uniref:Thioredoxin family protein n=1 Tax=Reichenbachiella agarivorans TaxID=2979464 RepID=A0ABY6CL42_9BACT|nr:thioredoxin family protein [Reichenbachiella agarivorans]UXP31232.1 thioredoxin family protein [Reichenbachiella agarivorans]
MLRKILATFLILFVFASIGFLFWQQELQYILPTPIPADYKIVPVNEVLSINDSSLTPQHKPRFYHFFKPTCPCSRFNVKYFNILRRNYESQVDFIVVLPEGSDYQEALDYFDKDQVLTIDQDMRLAHEFGVYSTPQAVIVTADQKLYYRGNYNKARYCTDPGSNFAQMAMDSLIQHRQAPDFGLLSTVSYGCGLPNEDFNIWTLNL